MKKLIRGLTVAAIMCLAAVSMAVPAAPAQAADEAVASDGHQGAITMFLVVATVAASPLTIGGSFGLTAVAWPGVFAAVGSGIQWANNPDGNGRVGRN